MEATTATIQATTQSMRGETEKCSNKVFIIAYTPQLHLASDDKSC